ncbi:MAG: sigma-70 family RNA polymerase sigma factor [Pedosphaera sp.]|nr:sigma-70 family RNA polymerase sigma factor [Pedosphaera sp.]
MGSTIIPLPVSPVFATTQWSVILRAGGEDSPLQHDAIAQLCRAYWYPLYAYVRRQGASPEDAQDLTQGFFARLIERKVVSEADADKGKFRWFILGTLKHYLANQHDLKAAAKRGGNCIHVSLDDLNVESRYQIEPVTTLSPDKLFDRSWAVTLLERVREQLREHYTQAGKLDRFERLESFIPGGQTRGSYEEVARDLGVSEGALRVELHRLKATYRQFLRSEIAHTVSNPVEIDEELRYLIEVMQG